MDKKYACSLNTFNELQKVTSKKVSLHEYLFFYLVHPHSLIYHPGAVALPAEKKYVRSPPHIKSDFFFAST